jgi:6,7-dimethyl-8-ribityllumazine synthase
MTYCGTCSTTRFMEFECVACCVRWLSKMTKAEIQTNAPVIEAVMGVEHMEKVRELWKAKR